MKRVPSLYRYLQFKIQEHSHSGTTTYGEVSDLLGIYHIPKKIRRIMIVELEEYKLIKQLKNKNEKLIRVINCRISDEYVMLDRLSRRAFFVSKV